MGSPEQPTPEQYSAIEAAGKLQMLGPPRWYRASGGKFELDVLSTGGKPCPSSLSIGSAPHAIGSFREWGALLWPRVHREELEV